MGYRLLLADDSITIQKVVELVMGPEDFQIKSFNDGEQAYEAISNYKPHVILADIDMPKLNGYELCQKIKADANTVHIPVILLAGAFEPFDEDLAKKSGADDFIIKPFESQELISKVKALLNDVSLDEETEKEPIVEDDIKADDVFAKFDDVPLSTDETSEDSTDITFNPEDMELLNEKPILEEEAPTQEENLTFQETLSRTIDEEPEDEIIPPAPVQEPPQPIQVNQPSQQQAIYIPQSIDLASLVAPSREDVLDLFKQAINKKVDYLINEDIKDMLTDTLREEILNNLKASFSDIVEEATKVVLKSVAEQIRDRAIIVLNNAIPDLVQNLIEKEIEKITTEL